MTKPGPRRLWQLSPDEDPLRLADLFRNARASVEGELPRLHWRIRHTLRQRATRPRRLFRLSLAVGLVFVAGGSVAAALHPYWHRQTAVELPRPVPAPQVTREPVRRRAVSTAMVSTPTPVVQEPASVTPEPQTAVARQAKPTMVRRVPQGVAAPFLAPPPAVPPPPPEPAAPPAPWAPPPPSPVAIEQALLGNAVKALRKRNDPRGALAMLEEHGRRFPHSMLSQEAAMLRAEALLGVGGNAEALSVMDRLALGALPNPAERLVLRGELRAAAGRWQEARGDFEAALIAGVGASRQANERALWGRASARSHAGDQAGARADLAAYLRSFPTGRFAAQATAALKGFP